MFAGPVFSREVMSAPRRPRLYAWRAAYVGGLLVLLSTAWQVLTGTQNISDTGELARFGVMSFQILAPLQLAVALFFAALSSAGAVAVEKDRRTLDLLLLTRLSNVELVLGKLFSSLLSIASLILAALPFFMLLALLGGVSFAQIGRVVAVAFASAIAAGSLGTLLAFWREKHSKPWRQLYWRSSSGWRSARLWPPGPSERNWRAHQQAPGRRRSARCVPHCRRHSRFIDHGEGPTGLMGQSAPADLFLIIASALTVLLNGLAIGLVRVVESLTRSAPTCPRGRGARRAVSRRRTSLAPGHGKFHGSVGRNQRCGQATASARSHATCVGQSRSLARGLHLGLRPKDVAGAPGLPGDLRRVGEAVCT